MQNPKIRFKGYTEAWEQRKLGEITDILSASRVHKEEWKTGGGSIGIPYIVPNNEPLYSKNADLIWVKKGEKHDPFYLYSYFVSPAFRKYLLSISHIGTIAHYTIEQVKKTPVFSPHLGEQRKIGHYFNEIDHLITLHQRKCDELQNIKKFMLQNMFV